MYLPCPFNESFTFHLTWNNMKSAKSTVRLDLFSFFLRVTPLLLVWRHSTLRFQSASSSSYTLNTGLFNAMVQDSCCHNGPAASETAWTAGRNIIVAARVCAWWSASMFLHAFWLGHIGAIEMPIVSFQCHLCQYLQLALQEGTTLYTLLNRL